MVRINKSAARTIEILHLISTQKKRLTITEISRALEIPKSTTHQLLQTLVQLKVLDVDENKTYQLGVRFLEIALPWLTRMDLRKEARPIMEEVCSKSGETIFLATHEGGDIVYLEQIEGTSMLKTSVSLGSRLPMNCTGLGKSLLAVLPEEKVREMMGLKLRTKTEFSHRRLEDLLADLGAVRVRGYAIDNQEAAIDIHCVAAPIHNHNGEPTGAMSIASPSMKMTEERQKRFGRLITEAALLLSRRLGYMGEKLFHQAG
ncbi:MAG: IclR family transcriptional regulator [Deltaproteobacteria bacterium]|nr:IclR family transcriptional regulator [Deltaproteobacteria bacterium]